MKRIFELLAITLTIIAVGAVHDHLTAQDVVAPAPAIVSPTYIAIPPRQQELITAQPSPAYVWVSGSWERTPDSWSWTAGKWVQPPFSNAYWVPGYWQHRSGQYVWQSAHWAAASKGVVVEKPVTAPAMYTEVQPAAPATSVVWQPGYWEWRGTWVWVAGEYIQTTTPNAVWVPGVWVAGTDGLYRWSPAHWAVA